MNKAEEGYRLYHSSTGGPSTEMEAPVFTKIIKAANPAKRFEELETYRAFEYYDTLFVKLTADSALNVQQRKVEIVSPQAPVMPVVRIEYWLEN